MGAIFGCRTSLDTAQLAARDYSLRAWSQSSALLGERQRPNYLAQVLEQKRDQLQQRCAISCLDYKLSVGQLQSNSVSSCANVWIRSLKTSSTSSA